MPDEENLPSKESESSLERLERRLYSRIPPPVRHDEELGSDERRVRIAPSWTAEEEKKSSGIFSFLSTIMPWLKRLFIASIIFFLFAAALAFYGFWRGGNTVSPQNISLATLGPVSAPAGETFSFEVTVGNYNELNLDSVDLLVTYPDGTRKPADVSVELPRYREALGALPAGGTVSRTLSIVPYGEEGETKIIKLTVEYRQKDSNAIFSRNAEYEFLINAAPVSVAVGAPKEVSSGQPFEVSFDITSNSSSLIKNLMVKADYPTGFQFEQSVPAPSFAKNIWLLGDVRPQSKRIVRVIGRLAAPEETERTFRFSIGTEHPKDEKHLGAVFLTEPLTVAVKKPFVSLDLALNGESGDTFIARSAQALRGDIVWANNLETKIADFEITVRLDGTIYNKSSVGGGNGFYDSNTATILWDKRSKVDFGVVAPGAGGTVSFNLSLLPVSTNPALYKNPSMIMQVFTRGKRLDEQGAFQEVSSSFSKEIRIASTLGLISELLYGRGPFVNTGPVPPKAETETTYTIVWSLSNSSNSLAGVKVSAALPSYVKWLDKVSPQSAKVEYSPVGGEVVWDVGEIASGVGFGASPREVSFQVSLLPSESQVGTPVVVIGEAVATGEDRFTGSVVRSNVRTQLTTASLEEVGVGSGAVTK